MRWQDGNTASSVPKPPPDGDPAVEERQRPRDRLRLEVPPGLRDEESRAKNVAARQLASTFGAPEGDAEVVFAAWFKPHSSRVTQHLAVAPGLAPTSGSSGLRDSENSVA